MSQSDIEVILFRLTEMDKKLEEARADIKTMAARPQCPNPGLCMVLQPAVEELKAQIKDSERRTRELESLRDKANGVGAAAKMIWMFIGAGGLGALVALSKLLGK